MEIEIGSKWVWKEGKTHITEEIEVLGFSELGHVLYKYDSGKHCHKNRKLFEFDFDKVIGE